MNELTNTVNCEVCKVGKSTRGSKKAAGKDVYRAAKIPK